MEVIYDRYWPDKALRACPFCGTVAFYGLARWEWFALDWECPLQGVM